MRWWLLIFLSLLQISSYAGENVSAELEFEQVTGAKSYQLELKSQSSGQIYTVNRSTHLFQFHIRPGKYEVRTRVADQRGVFGEWSESQSFAVEPPKSDHFTNFPEKDLFVAKDRLSHVIELRWQHAAGADHYLVKYKNEANESFEKIVYTERLSLDLPPGEYSFEIWSLTPDDVSSLEALISKKNLVLIAAELDPPKMQDLQKLKDGRLKFKSTGPVNFVLEERKFLAEDWNTLYEGRLETTWLILDEGLKPGHYKMTVWTSKKGFRDSQKLAKEFVIKPEEKDILF